MSYTIIYFLQLKQPVSVCSDRGFSLNVFIKYTIILRSKNGGVFNHTLTASTLLRLHQMARNRSA